jgi:hypothetical protein
MKESQMKRAKPSARLPPSQDEIAPTLTARLNILIEAIVALYHCNHAEELSLLLRRCHELQANALSVNLCNSTGRPRTRQLGGSRLITPRESRERWRTELIDRGRVEQTR